MGTQSEQKPAYRQIIQEMTVSRAWGMSELSNWLLEIRNRLRGNSSAKGIWYLIAPDDELILPTVFGVDSSNEEKEYYPSIFIEVEKAIEAYFASREGNLPDLREYEAIAQMTLDEPASYSNMVPWLESIPSCLKEIKRYQQNGECEYRLYMFSPPRYMRLRNEPLMTSSKGVKPESFQTYNTAVMVFESDIQSREYSRYLHGEHTESLANDSGNEVDKGTRIRLTDKRIKELLPVPLSFVGMGQRGRFLAYDLTIPQSISEESMTRLSLTELQNFLLCESIARSHVSVSEINPYIEEHAFLYSIRIDKDIIMQLNNLIEGTQDLLGDGT